MTRLHYSTAAIVFLLALGLRLPPALQEFRLVPDSISYLDIARRTADRKGFTSALDLISGRESEVVHTALADWPPLYPLFAGGLLKVGAGEVGLQVANAALVALAAVLVYLLGAGLFDLRTGAAAGLLAALAPNLFRSGITALSDPLGLVLALGALLVVLGNRADRAVSWAALGLLMGLACITRCPYAVLIPLMLIAARKRGLREMVLCAGAAALVILPLAAARLWAGCPLLAAQALHCSVDQFSGAIWTQDPPRIGFQSLPGLAVRVARHTWLYCTDFFAGPRGLYACSLGLIVSIASRGTFDRPDRRLVLAAAAANFALICLTWSIPPVRGSRFLLFSYCLLMPFACAGLFRAWDCRGKLLRAVAPAAGAATLTAYCWGCFTVASSPEGCFDHLDPATSSWIRQSLPSNSVVASNNPWMVNYTSRLPAVALPRDLDADGLRAFIDRRGIDAVLVFPTNRPSCTMAALADHDEYDLVELGELTAALVAEGRYGQNAYDGKRKTMPQMVQKLPTIHSPRITPRKNGSALR